MSATIKLTLSDYSVRERLDGWWRIPTVAQYLYPNGETQQFMNMLDELDGVVHDTEAQLKTGSRSMITLIFLRVWHLNIARRFPSRWTGGNTRRVRFTSTGKNSDTILSQYGI